MGHNLEGTLASDAGCADATLRAPARHPSGARLRSLSGGSPEAARAARSVPGASLAPVSGRPSLPPSASLAGLPPRPLLVSPLRRAPITAALARLALSPGDGRCGAGGSTDRDAAELDGPTFPLGSRARLGAGAAGLLLAILFIALAAAGLLVGATFFGHSVGGIG